MKYSIIINVGFLWYNQLRDVLREYEWLSKDFSWKEGTGWLERNFYVKGNFKDIEELEDRFYSYSSGIKPCD